MRRETTPAQRMKITGSQTEESKVNQQANFSPCQLPGLRCVQLSVTFKWFGLTSATCCVFVVARLLSGCNDSVRSGLISVTEVYLEGVQAGEKVD